MIELSSNILAELEKRNKVIIPVVEIYPRATIDIVSSAAPASAIGRFSNVCFDWTNDTGSYNYDAKVNSFPEIISYLDERINTAEVTFSNVKRGAGAMSKFVLDNRVKGCWMVIRLIFPDAPNDSLIVFWGKCNRPGELDSKTLSLTATQDIGDYTHELPFRSYQINCPLDFGRPRGGCLGNETLEQKSPAYQQAFALYSTAGCNKLYSTCAMLENIKHFQGQRVSAVSGQFSYITVEEVIKRVLFWTKRKKIKTLKTESWSSVNQSEGSEEIPLAFGRCQIQGHPFTWADIGEQVRSLQGFCEGKISAFNFIRSRTEGINIVSTIEHLGDYGGVGNQVPDTLFNGTSGYNSGLAYLELITDGSSNTQVDDAPIITAVIKGLEVPLPNSDGEYTEFGWTNNPVHYTRFLLTDTRFGKIPLQRINDTVAYETSLDCDDLVEDRTNDEAIVLPSNEYENYGVGYRRYRSASRYTPYLDLWNKDSGSGLVDYALQEPEFEEPEIRWFHPFQPYTLPPSNVVLRQKYTFNGALQEKTSLLDFLTKRVLPTFKGFISYGFDGKIQIKNRKKADNGYIRMDTKIGDHKIPISSVRPWVGNYTGYLLIGVSLEEAEIREVTGVEFSTACNAMPITATVQGTTTATTSTTLSGGSKTAPAMGYIQLGGTVAAGDTVRVTFDSGDDEFFVSYTAEGIEDVPCFARMFTAFLNAHLQFKNYLTAYISPEDETKILIRCESGYLNLDAELEYVHKESEEVLRVQAVFENCGELTANKSARFDNIIQDSFKVASDEEEDINAVTATYTSAVDDFHLTKLLPRAAWDTIDLEGELKKKEIDLTFVDNYWQAAYLTKCEAIESIDGNLPFTFTTGLRAINLEFGDVVAVRHDSGDGAFNYIPVYITVLKPDINKFTVELGTKLYLSAAHDLNVQPIDVLLTTTLNTTENPNIPPPTIGGSGGTSQSSEPVIVRPNHDYYNKLGITSKFSPDGRDLV